jgi:hypothetical protein
MTKEEKERKSPTEREYTMTHRIEERKRITYMPS